MRKVNKLPATLCGTKENPYALIDGYTTIAQCGSDTIHLVGDEEAYFKAPACGVGFQRETELKPYIGHERTRRVCRRCRIIVGENPK